MIQMIEMNTWQYKINNIQIEFRKVFLSLTK